MFQSLHPRLVLHHDTLVSSRWRLGIARLLNLANHQLKSLVDILVITCTGFYPRTLELFAERLAFCGGYLSLFRSQVGLIANNHDGDEVCALGWSVSFGGGEGGR
jgi:hypothetical protein